MPWRRINGSVSDVTLVLAQVRRTTRHIWHPEVGELRASKESILRGLDAMVTVLVPHLDADLPIPSYAAYRGRKTRSVSA